MNSCVIMATGIFLKGNARLSLAKENYAIPYLLFYSLGEKSRGGDAVQNRWMFESGKQVNAARILS